MVPLVRPLGNVYVVVTVAAGLPGEIASFTLSEDHGAFEREEIRLEVAGE